jgi:hypothetical protein
MIMVPREHQEYRHDPGRHHHNALGSDRIWVDLAVVVSSHTLLLILCVAVQSAKIDVAGRLVNPRVFPRGLKALVDYYCREREKQAVQSGRVRAEGTITLQ